MPLTKNHLQRIPFIRITILFLMGIHVNHFLQIGFQWMGILSAVLILMLILSWSDKHFPGVKTQNILIALGIFLSGMLYSGKVDDEQTPAYNQKDYFVAEICQKPIEKPKTWQSILRIQNNLNPKPEKVIGYFSKANFDTTIIAGDQLILFAKPQAIRNMGIPFEFDFRRMMHHKGIDYSVYLANGTYKKTGKRIRHISYWAEQMRDQLVGLLERTKIEKEEKAVISALTLGYRAELDPETLTYFTNTGTIHVLSVSGLHVALIFFILSFLFSGINKGRIGKIVYPTLLILFLWIYAFITGFSPPIQRSTIMFSFVIIGHLLRRPINIYNSLCASALVLILMDPNVLFDIGFQLSYLAIFGIVMLQPPFERLINYENKMMKGAWTLLTVSLAAQLMTFPLSLFYFNQFPNLFWLSNYIAIPGTTLLMWLTFGFFALSPFPLFANFLAQLIQLTTHLMLGLLKWMSELPLAVTGGIVLSPLQTWIIYGFMAAFIVYGFSKNKTWLYGGLVLIILLQTSTLWDKFSLFGQKAIYVYNSKNNLIQFINGRKSYVLSCGSNSISDKEIEMILHVSHHLKLRTPQFLIGQAIHSLDTDDLSIKGETLQFLNCKIHCSDQLSFEIQGCNGKNFKNDNPQLSMNDLLDEGSSSHISSLSEEFSFNFKTKRKESVYIRLE